MSRKRTDLIRRTRFHLLSKAVMQMKIKKVKSKAAKLSNAKTREQFYHKYQAKYEEHVAKTNFFKPKGRGNAENRVTTNLFRFSGRKWISWDLAKAVVFSSSSSDSDDDNSNQKFSTSDTRRAGANALWLAAAGASYIGNIQNINRDGISRESDEGEPWATAVDPAQHADCDKTPSAEDSQELWSAAADPAAYEDCERNSMRNSHDNSSSSINDSVIIFYPLAILGHHNIQLTANPNITILW